MNTTGIFRELLNAASSKSGVAVNETTALQASTAFACGRVISEGLAQVPFKVFREEGEKKSPARDHPLYPIVTLKPNDFQTSFELRETIGLHLAFAGRAYVWKNYVRGKIVELLPFEPSMVTAKRVGWETEYTARMYDGSLVKIPKDEMWHLKGPSWNGWQGMEGIKLAREAIGLAIASEEHGARFFSNGATIPGVLSTEQSLKDPAVRQALRDSIAETNAGSKNAWKMLLTWGGIKYTPAALGNDSAQLLETRRFQVEEVCRFFRMLPIMVGHSDKTQAYASAEQMFIAHVVHTMMPWYTRVEQSAAVNLLTDEEIRQGYYIQFIANGLMRGTAKDRAEYFAKMYGIGALNPNEIRALEDNNPYDGGEKYRVPLNMVDPNQVPPTNTGA